MSGGNHINGTPSVEDYTRRICNALGREYSTLTGNELISLTHVIAGIQIDEGRRQAASLKKPNRN